MPITVEDAMKIGGLKKGKIIAGHEGSINIVENINVLEIADFSTYETIPDWLFKNDLYISALFAVKNSVPKQIQMIKILAERKTAGIILCHVGESLKTVSKELISICNELKYPLIQVPPDMPYIEILVPLMDTILKKNTTKLKFSIEVQEKLDALILEDYSIHDLCKSIKDMTKSSIILLDINHTILSSCGFDEASAAGIAEFCRMYFRNLWTNGSRPDKIFRNIENKKYMFSPIISGYSYYGLIVIETGKMDVELLSMAIHQAGIAFALLFTKSKRIEAVNDTYFRDFLGDLITWNFRNKESAHLRAQSLGWNIEKFKIHLIVNIDSLIDKDKSITGEGFGYIEQHLMSCISELVTNENSSNRIGLRSDMVLVFLADIISEESIFDRARKLSDKIIQYIVKQKIFNVTIGISNMINQPVEIERAYKEAVLAVQLGRQYMGSQHSFEYRQIEYVAELKKAAQNKLKSDHLFAPIYEYDQKHKMNLYETLENLFKYHFDTALVADKMNLHRNTVLYRKNKLISIFNYNPFVHPYKLNIEIAFALKNIQ